MDSVRDALRASDIEKDMFDRLVCVSCQRTLKLESDPAEIGSVRICPECGEEWQEVR